MGISHEALTSLSLEYFITIRFLKCGLTAIFAFIRAYASMGHTLFH